MKVGRQRSDSGMKKYMEAYKRFRALRAEMDMKVGPVLRSRLSVRR